MSMLSVGNSAECGGTNSIQTQTPQRSPETSSIPEACSQHDAAYNTFISSEHKNRRED